MTWCRQKGPEIRLKVKKKKLEVLPAVDNINRLHTTEPLQGTKWQRRHVSLASVTSLLRGKAKRGEIYGEKVEKQSIYNLF